MRISYSQLKEYRRCRQKYYWQRLERRREPSWGLVRGDAGHHALSVWYRQGTQNDAITAAHDTLFTRNEELYAMDRRAITEDRTLALFQREDAERALDLKKEVETNTQWALLQTALERYLPWEALQGWRERVLDVEVELEVSLGAYNGIEYTFVSYVDLALAPEGRDEQPVLCEHKFVKDARHNHLLLDPQISTYFAMWRKVKKEFPQYFIYNSVRLGGGKTAEREPARRSIVTRTPEGAAHTWREIATMCREMVMWRQEVERRKKNFESIAPLVYRNAIADCSWDCGLYETCLHLEVTGKIPPPGEKPPPVLDIEVD